MAKTTSVRSCAFLLTEAGEGEWKYLTNFVGFPYLLFGRDGNDIMGYVESKNPNLYLKKMFPRAEITSGNKLTEIERKIKTLVHVEKGNKTDKRCSKCKQVIAQPKDKIKKVTETPAVEEVSDGKNEEGVILEMTSHVHVLDTSL